MHEMWTIATDVPVAWCVYPTLSVTRIAETTAPIEVLLGEDTPGGPKNIVLARGRGVGELVHCSVYKYNCSHLHSPDGATFDAPIDALL